jgi:hypothetical protein
VGDAHLAREQEHVSHGQTVQRLLDAGTPHGMKTLRFAIVWWVVLAGWWLLLVGTNSGLELIAAVCAAALATLLALALRRQGLLRYHFDSAWIVQALKLPWKVLQELGVVLWALALHVTRARRVRSVYRAIPFPAGRADAESAGRRAVAVLADSLSPNTLPVDVDRERNVALRHELDPRYASDEMP